MRFKTRPRSGECRMLHTREPINSRSLQSQRVRALPQVSAEVDGSSYQGRVHSWVSCAFQAFRLRTGECPTTWELFDQPRESRRVRVLTTNNICFYVDG